MRNRSRPDALYRPLTARAGKDGVAVSFCASDERPYLKAIERKIKQEVRSADASAYLKAPAPCLRDEAMVKKVSKSISPRRRCRKRHSRASAST